MADDAVLTIGGDVSAALAGLLAVEGGLKAFDAMILATTATVRTASLMMATAFVGVGVAIGSVAMLGVAKSVRAFEDYEQQLANAASVTGKTGEEFTKTKQNIDEISKTLGATTVFSAQQAANAMYDLASAGYDVSKMVSGDLKPILDLSAATQSDLTQTTEIVTATLGQFQLGIESSQRVSDVFAKTIGSSKATLEKLGLSFKYVGTIANQFDDSIEDVGAGLAVMYNNGLRGEQAGRALRIAYGRLANPTADVKEVVRELGLTLENVNPELYGMTEILNHLTDAGISVGQAMKLFGVEAGTGMGAALDNLPLLQQLQEGLYGAGGAAEDMALKQLDTLKGSVILLKSLIENLEIEIGQRFAPYIRNMNMEFREVVLMIVENVQPAFDWFQQTLRDLAPTFTAVKSIATSLYGIFLDLMIAFGLGSGTVKTLTDFINEAAIALALFFKWLDEHEKITKLVVALGLAIVAFSWIYPVVSIAVGAIETIITVIAVMNGIMTGSIVITEGLTAALAALFSPITIIAALIAVFAAAYATNLFGIRDITNEVFGWIKDKFWDLIDSLEHYINEFGQMYNKVIDFLGLDLPKMGLIAFEQDVRDSVDNIKEAFDFNLGDLGLGAIDVDALGTLEAYRGELEDVANLTEDIEDNLGGAVEDNSAMAKELFTVQRSEVSTIAEREAMGRGGILSETKVFENYDDVAEARRTGQLKTGDTFIVTVNVDKMTTDKYDEDSIEDIFRDAMDSAGAGSGL